MRWGDGAAVWGARHVPQTQISLISSAPSDGPPDLQGNPEMSVSLVVYSVYFLHNSRKMCEKRKERAPMV